MISIVSIHEGLFPGAEVNPWFYLAVHPEEGSTLEQQGWARFQTAPLDSILIPDKEARQMLCQGLSQATYLKKITTVGGEF